MARTKKSSEPIVKSFQLFDDPEIDSKVNSGSFKTVETKSSKADKEKVKPSKKIVKNKNGRSGNISTDSGRHGIHMVSSSAVDKQVNKRRSGKDEQGSEPALHKSKSAGKKSAVAKADKSKASTNGKRSAKTDKSAKRKDPTAGKQVKVKQVIPAEPAPVKKIETEPIEDNKSKNAPSENLIGKLCPKTHQPYKQIPCCKKGWTYMDVTDLKWNREHIGYGANDYHSNRFAEDIVEKEESSTESKKAVKHKKKSGKSERVKQIEKRAKIRAKIRK